MTMDPYPLRAVVASSGGRSTIVLIRERAILPTRAVASRALVAAGSASSLDGVPRSAYPEIIHR